MIEVVWSKIHGTGAEVASCPAGRRSASQRQKATGDILTHAERFMRSKEVSNIL
jgi:hypothetical protein